MSSESLALSDIWVGTPDEAEYDGVYAAVMATERGRWFLTEYASRNRQTDTHAVLGALARLEAAVRGRTHAADAPVKAANGTEQMQSRQMQSRDVAAAAERIQDIAFMLRERAADADLCDALDAAVREIAGTCSNGTRLRARDKIEPTSAADDNTLFATSGLLTAEPQETAKFTEPVATLPVTLHSPSDELAPASRPQEKRSDAIIAALGHESDLAAAPANGSDESQRWYIEPPDFAFHRADPAQPGTEPPEAPAENGHSLLPQAQLLPGPQDDPADLFESPAEVAAAAIVTPGPAIITPVAIEPPLLRPAPRPQLDPLPGLRALSEEEVIALFS